jgi:hypothetical protein
VRVVHDVVCVHGVACVVWVSQSVNI